MSVYAGEADDSGEAIGLVDGRHQHDRGYHASQQRQWRYSRQRYRWVLLVGCCLLLLAAISNVLLVASIYAGAATDGWFKLSNSDSSGGGLPRQTVTAAVSSLPSMSYAFSSFAVTEPEASANFLIRYMGAIPLPHSEFLCHRQLAPTAQARGVRFSASGGHAHDVYFISDPTRPDGGIPVRTFEAYRKQLHRFDLEDAWDWWQDWHLCLHVDSPDPVAKRLLIDDIPFVTRSTSLYVEVPGGLTFQVLGRSMDVAWTEPFLFCRQTDGQTAAALERGPRQTLNVSRVPALRDGVTLEQLAGPLPEFYAAHHAFPTSQPEEAQAFMMAHTPAVSARPAFELQHKFGNGECGLLKWVEFHSDSAHENANRPLLPSAPPRPNFQLHFVHQYHKYDGDNLTVTRMEKFLRQLRTADRGPDGGVNPGVMPVHDAYLANRVGFTVADLRPYIASLGRAGVGYRLETSDHLGGQSLLMTPVPGVVLELLSPATQPDPRIGSEIVLVAGATGRTGVLIWRKLRDAGFTVRALVRSRAKAVEVLGCDDDCGEGGGIFVGDITDLSSLGAAFEGVNRLIILTSSVPVRNGANQAGQQSTADTTNTNTTSSSGGGFHYADGGSPQEVDWLGNTNLVRAAVSAGTVRHVVLVSSKGTTEPESWLDLMGGGHSLFYKLQSEVFLMASEIENWTIVKPCGLVDDSSWLGQPTRLVVSHDDEYTASHTIPRSALAVLLLRTIQLPLRDVAQARFDVCSTPLVGVNGRDGAWEEDWLELFAQGRRVARP